MLILTADEHVRLRLPFYGVCFGELYYLCVKDNAMKNIQKIAIAEYDYPLPDERIAKYPLAERDTSKLLLYKGGEIIEEKFANLPSFIPQGALMVFNNTRVIQARLRFRKETGAQIEVFCLEPDAPADYQLSFQSTRECVWQCLVGNSSRWKSGVLSHSALHLTIRNSNRFGLRAHLTTSRIG